MVAKIVAILRCSYFVVYI